MNHNDATPQLIGKSVATSKLLGKPAAANNVVTGSLKKRQAQRIDIPAYDDIELDSDGASISPCGFLPTIFDKLPEQWFYATYRWYNYFDKNQRT